MMDPSEEKKEMHDEPQGGIIAAPINANMAAKAKKKGWHKRLKKPKKMMMMMMSPNNNNPDYAFCGDCNDQDKDQAMMNDVELANIMKQRQNEKRAMEEDTEGDPKQDTFLRTRLQVDNLDSSSQVLVIQSLLTPIAGVSRVTVQVEEQMVVVDHDASTDDDALVQTLKQMGYFARLEDTVTTAEATTNPTDRTASLVRTQLFVKGICCASECPSINKILRPIPGVSKVQINTTTKMVYVHHDPATVDSHELAMALHGQGFDSVVYKDGAAGKSLPATVGRTTLHIQKALNQSDVLPIQQLLSTMQGVKRVGVNAAESVVQVEHDVTKLSAESLQKIMHPLYPNTIANDAQDDIQRRAHDAFSVARSKYVESTLYMSNLSLKHIHLLEKTYRQNYIPAQLRAFYPHVPSKTIKIEHNPQLLRAQAVATLMARYGMDTRVAVDGGVENLALPLLEEYETPPIYGGMQVETETKLHINILLSGLFWFVSVLSFVGGHWEYLRFAGLFSVLFGLPPVAIKAWRTLRRCQFDANCMMVVAAVGALALEEYDEAASVAFLFAISEYLEAKATARARKALGAIVTLRPDHANVIHPDTGEVVIVPAEKVPVGSLIRVRTGDKIAADGIIKEGSSTIDESSLTGEAAPAVKHEDDLVAGGSINIGDSPLVIKTTSSVEDSAVSRLIRLVEDAQSNRSPTEKLVDAFAKAYTPVVLAMAGLMCTIPWFFGSETGRYWTLNGLIIIVIACPCALTISTPVTYAAGLAATAQRGVIVKGGANLEALGSVDKIIFDKTGTLTTGKFVLNNLESVGTAISRKEMLELLVTMESPSSHPLASTLVGAARKEGVMVSRHLELREHCVLKGEGVTALVDGKRVHVGNARLFSRLGLYDQAEDLKKKTEAWSEAGGTVGFLGTEDHGIVAAYCVTDAVREEAHDVIKSLLEVDMEVVMLTGDGEGAAKAVAQRIGLSESSIHSQLSPEDKLHFVGSLIQPDKTGANVCLAACSEKSLVLMCGDGINDAPALAVADVGVAMGEGASLAMEMSDITLMDSNLSKLVYSLQMGSRVVMTIQENIFLSIVAKLLVVALTFAGKMTLLWAIAADVGVMLLVTLNGMKLLPTTYTERKRKRKPRKSGPYDRVHNKQDEDGLCEIELV